MDLRFDIDSDFEPVSPKKHSKKSWSVSSLLVVLVVLVVGAYGGLLYYQKTGLLTELDRLQTSINTLETQITGSQNDEEKQHFVSPDLTLKAIDERTEWSELILQIKALETGEVTFSYFTVTTDGETSIRGTARSLTAVKTMLTRLQNNPQIRDPFVPNIELSEKPGPGLVNVEFDLLFNFTPN